MPLTDNLNKQILVVEDEGLIAADIQRRLERLGYPAAVTASSGAEALRCAHATPFDLVLMDIRLQGELDGITTAQLLKDELDTPVVYMTAHADAETISRAKVTEPLGYLLKPVTDSDLRSTVEISLYKHEIERRLRNSEAWLSATLQSVGDGIIATTISGEVIFMNARAAHLTGWSSDEANGHMLTAVLGLFEESGVRAKSPILDLLPGESRRYVAISKKSIRTDVEVEYFQNRSTDAVLGSVVVVRDVSRCRESDRRMMREQTMDAIANMAGGLAADLSDQLTIIVDSAERLVSRLSRDEKEQVLAMHQAASMAAGTTKQLFTLGRRQAVRCAMLDVNELICEVQPQLSSILGDRAKVTTKLGRAGTLYADRNQIKQLLLNLAMSARSRTHPGGEFHVESSTIEIDAETPEACQRRLGRLFGSG